MKKLSSKKQFNSAVPGFEEVKVTLNRMTQGKRIQLELEHAEPMSQIRTIQGEINELIGDGGEDWYSKLDAPAKRKLNEFIASRDLVANTKINPAWVKYGLNKIENLQDEDGNSITPETFIDSVDPELYDEVLKAIQAEAGLSTEERKN